MIRFDRVTYRYPGAKAPILRDVSLEIGEGEFALVIGASGAGKSTLLRCINGLVPHFYGGVLEGTVRVAGRDPVQAGPAAMSRLVGFVFQNPEAQFVVDTVEAELAFAMENHNLPPAAMRKRIEEVLDQLGIAHLRERRISTLSGGEKQRVAIAAVLTLQPQVLVLDEPTSQLDPQAAEEVLTALQKLNADLGLTIVLSEHRLERVLQYADRLIYLPGGGQAPLQGAPQEILAQIDLAPPLVQLGKALGWHPLPLTIKEARRLAEGLSLQASPLSIGSPSPSPVEIAIHDLWYAYDGRPALRGITLEIHQGECVALMGRNGSGKTTLLKHLVGLLQPARGSVLVRGLDTRRVDLETLIRFVGYVPQNPDALLFAERVRDELAFTRANHGLADAAFDEALLERLGLAPLAEAYPRDLSVGERQRVALASILAARPEIILLDEPTRGADYLQKRALARYLAEEKAQGHTVILSTHDVELAASLVDRVIILGDGEVVVDGPTREVMTHSLVFSTQMGRLFRDDRFLTVEDVLRGVK